MEDKKPRANFYTHCKERSDAKQEKRCKRRNVLQTEKLCKKKNTHANLEDCMCFLGLHHFSLFEAHLVIKYVFNSCIKIRLLNCLAPGSHRKAQVKLLVFQKGKAHFMCFWGCKLHNCTLPLILRVVYAQQVHAITSSSHQVASLPGNICTSSLKKDQYSHSLKTGSKEHPHSLHTAATLSPQLSA